MVSASKTNNYNIDDGQNGTPDNQRGQKIALFDVDGTLTPARQEIRPEMIQVLKNLRKKITIGVVGGSDLVKQKEQLGPETLSMYDYNFAENGVIAYKDGVLINSTSISDFLGEERIKIFINFCLHYIADLDLPIKRGTFIEFRTGMLNVSPIGRNCSKKERDEFEQYCLKHDIRKNFVKTLKEKFEPDYGLQYSIGGQISFDVFPKGWDKTYCLQFLNASESVNPKANSDSESKSNFQEIHFFGDKTFEGGNDYEIFNDKRVIGHTVTSPEDTIKQLEDLFGNVNV